MGDADRPIMRDLSLFALAQRLSGVGHWRLDPKTDELEWSDEVYRILGHEPGALTPTPDVAMSAYHPDDREAVGRCLRRTIHTGDPFELQVRVVRTDGTRRWVWLSGFRQSRSEGAVWVFGVVRDITELVEAQRGLLDDQERLRMATESARAGIWEWLVERDTLVWDRRMFEIYGLEPSAGPLPVQAWRERLHPDDADEAQRQLEEALQGVQQFRTRFRIVRPTGEVRHVVGSGLVGRDVLGRPVRMTGITFDVTEDTRQEARFQRALEGLGVGCLLVDASGRVELANGRASAVLAAQPGELVGRPLEDLIPEAEALARVTTADVRGDDTGAPVELESQANRLDGQTVPIRLSIGRLDHEEGTQLILSISDISAEKELEGHLAHAQRMETVGQLAGGIAHDFNNLLSVLLGHHGFLRQAVGDDPEALESVEAVRRVAERGASLTRHLLAYSRRQSLRPETVDVTAMLSDVVAFLRRTLPASIEIALDAPDETASVTVDRHRLEDVFVNLAVNSHHAMPTGGTLSIRAQLVQRDEDLELPRGEYVRFSIADSGQGMPADVIERAFDPYFTTKPAGEGSGLGLAMVYGFIRQSGGLVWLDSQPAQGTTVSFDLPRVPESAPVALPPAASSTTSDGSGGVSILLVEDEPEVRRIAVRVLRKAGHRVVEAGTVEEGREALRRSGGTQLLFTDITLPGQEDGLDLARWARSLQPELPVLVATGYGREVSQRIDALGSPAALLLEKPYSRRQLLDAVESLVG